MRITVPGLLLILGSFSASGQTSEINSGKIIDDAIEQHEKGEYKKAIALYTSIPRNDTNYVRALYELSLSYTRDSNFNAALDVANRGLAEEFSDFEHELLISKGSILDDMGQSEKSLLFFDSALVKYPASERLLLNKAIVLLRMKKYEAAETILQKLVLANPYYSTAHMKLANATLSEGRIVPAMFSLFTYLLINPSGSNQKQAINLLDMISKYTDPIREVVEGRKQPENAFTHAEQIITSKIALDKKYKLMTDVDDPIIRQLQALMEVLQFDAGSDDFYMQYYAPIFKQIFTEKMFEPLVHQAFSGVQLEAIQKYIKKNSKDIKNASLAVVAQLNTIRNTRELNFTKRETAPKLYHFNEQDVLIGKGKLNNEGGPAGDWLFYYTNGNTKAAGKFTEAGKRTGLWKYYYYNATPNSIENWSDGVQTGESIIYYRNGVLKEKSFVKDDKLNGDQTNYYWTGTVKSVTRYKDNEEDGPYKEFYSSGRKFVEGSSAKAKFHGVFETWHRNGKPNMKASYVNGELDGPYKSWYDNGQLMFEGTYVAGKLQGQTKNYHENGKLKETYTYNKGEAEGENLEYNDEGTLITKLPFVNGTVTGTGEYYDHDGKLYSKLVFNKGAITDAKYFDKTGKEIAGFGMKKKQIDITVHSPEGFKVSQTSYDENGLRINEQTYFYSSGKVKEKNFYKAGNKEGVTTAYYLNGKKEYEISFSEDEKNGPGVFYYPNGQVKSRGFYLNDEANGDWEYFNEKGKLTERVTYRNGDISGYDENYNGNGVLDFEEIYLNGWIMGIKTYDSTGKLIRHSAMKNGTGVYETSFANGQKRFSVNYKDGEFDGPYTAFYFNGSPKAKRIYDRGLLNGPAIEYHFNGKQAMTGEYEYGKKKGIWKFYDEEGRLWKEEPFINDELEGTVVLYHTNGKQDRTIEYHNGEYHGSFKRFGPDGELRSVIYYNNGDVTGYSYNDKTGKLLPKIALPGGTGKVVTYFTNGNKSTEMSFEDSKLQGHYMLYHSNGKLYYETDQAENLSTGKMTQHFQSGTLESEYTFFMDNLDGPFKEYHENGKIREEGNYYNGLQNGWFNYYDATGKKTAQKRFYYGMLLEVK